MKKQNVISNTRQYSLLFFRYTPPQYTCRPSWECCLEQVFHGEPVSACSFKKELHRRRYQACNLLKRNSIRDHFLQIFLSFKTHLRTLVRSSFLVALQTVYCQPAIQLKGSSRNFQNDYFLEHTNAQSCKMQKFFLLLY